MPARTCSTQGLPTASPDFAKQSNPPKQLTIFAISNLRAQHCTGLPGEICPSCSRKADLPRVPAHWRTFNTRKSLLSGSQRLAANPANAILNYLYAVLESETRLAVAALGLDPGLGFWHVDTPARDSLACDLMEPVRPRVDAFLLDWITREPLKRAWFFEQQRRKLPIDERSRNRVVSNRPDVGPSCRTDCRMGRAYALVQLQKSHWSGRAAHSFDATATKRG